MGKTVDYITQYNKKYPGSGESSLVNGVKGSTDFSDGSWQGWKSSNLEIVIDLKQKTNISFIKSCFLEDHSSRIFLPKEVVLSFSNDGSTYSNLLQKKIFTNIENRQSNRFEVSFKNIDQLARYVKIKGIGQKVCPEWHSAKGGHCWLFSDEIIIN